MINSSVSLINSGELETYLEQEKQARKKARLVQVRCQSKEISYNIRQAVEKERDNQLQLAGAKRKQKILDAADRQLETLYSQYSTGFDHIGEAHKSVKIQEKLNDLLIQKTNINTEIADHRGKAALFQMRQFQDQKEQEEFKRTQKRKEIMQNERIRAAKVATLPKRPVDPLNECKSPMRKGKLGGVASATKSSNKKPSQQHDENKENGSQTNSISLKSEKSRRKRRVSVGYKNKQSNGVKSKAKILYECQELPPVVVSRNQESSQDARKLANDLNAIANDRFKDAMNKVQAEKNKQEVMKTLEKLDKLEKLKESKYIGEDNEWKTTYDREEQQLRMEKLVEDMMHVDIVDKTPVNQPPDVEEVDSHLSLLNAVVRKPEIIKIASPTVRVHKSPVLMDTSPEELTSPSVRVHKTPVVMGNSPEKLISPLDSSLESFKYTPEPVTSPSYMHRSPKLVQSDTSSATEYRLETINAAGRIRWQPRNLTVPAYRLKDPKQKTATPKPATPRRRSSVHKSVVTRELLKNFFESRGVQLPISPMKKAFTKSYVQSPETSEVVEFVQKSVAKLDPPKSQSSPSSKAFFPPLDVNERHDNEESTISRATWANELVNNQLETSMISNQSDDSLTKEIKKVEAKEVKVIECSKDIERITEEKSHLQEELEIVRQLRQELENKQKQTEEDLQEMYYQQKENEEIESEDEFVDISMQQEANVTTRRRRCPVTINRGMYEDPHELSTIAELDSPRNSSEHTMRVTLSPLTRVTLSPPLRRKLSFGHMDGPGISEEPQISFLDTFSREPSPIKSPFISPFKKSRDTYRTETDTLSPLSEMLQQAKLKSETDSPRSLYDTSLTDSLMSFQRHELSTYNDFDANFSPGASPIFQIPRSIDPASDSEVEEIIQKWQRKRKSK